MTDPRTAPRGEQVTTTTTVKVRREPVPIELVRPSFYGMLVFYYCGIATYGATSIAFLSPSLVLVGGDLFAFWWAGLVTGGAALAVAGVIASRRLDIGWIEFISTVLLISLFAGYSVALLIRGVTVPDATGAIPIAWLPAIMSVMPAWRIFVMATDGTVIFRAAKRRALAASQHADGEHGRMRLLTDEAIAELARRRPGRRYR